MKQKHNDVIIINFGLAKNKTELQAIIDNTSTALAAVLDESYASAAVTLAQTILSLANNNNNRYEMEVDLVKKYIEIQTQQGYVDKAANFRQEFYDCFLVFWEDTFTDTKRASGNRTECSHRQYSKRGLS